MMNKTLKLGLIFLSIGTLIYIGYLTLLGMTLHLSLWEHEPIPVLAATIVGFSLIGPLAWIFIAAVIQIQKVKKYAPIKLMLLIVVMVAGPLAPLGVYRYIDRHNYEVTYTFTPGKWEEADTRDRSLLIDSFREQYDLVGENIDIVIDLLGEPDIIEESQYIYDLGDFRTWLAMDPYFYLITFDGEDIITSEGIYQG
jgi:hypothetical protein